MSFRSSRTNSYVSRQPSGSGHETTAVEAFFLEAVFGFVVLAVRFFFATVVFVAVLVAFFGDGALLTSIGSGVTGTALEPRTGVDVFLDLFCFGVPASDVSLVLLELRVTRLFLEAEAPEEFSSGILFNPSLSSDDFV